MLFNIIEAVRQGDSALLKIFITVALISIPIFLFALSVHETAHGVVAYKLGDPTAKMQGRLSLNPTKHFDIFGFIMLLVFGFGWAKPVPINTRYFKNPKRDMAISALAGPLSNLLLALGFAGLFKLYSLSFTASTFGNEIFMSIPWRILGIFLYYGISLNIMFAIFNLLPIPPLDGSRILQLFIPSKYYYQVLKYERYIVLAVFALIFFGLLDGPIAFVTDKVMWLFAKFTSLFFGEYGDYLVDILS